MGEMQLLGKRLFIPCAIIEPLPPIIKTYVVIRKIPI